jgi:transposase
MTPLLTDELWSTVEPLLPKHQPSPKGGHPRCNDRQCLEGVLYVLRGGIAWRLLPKDFGVSSSSCWRRFDEWTQAGVWDKVHRKLLSELGQQGALDIDRAIIDSASVRAQKGGRIPDRTRPTAVNPAANGM